MTSEGKEKEGSSTRLAAEGIAATRTRVVNSDLGHYAASTDMSNLKPGEEAPLEAVKKLNQQPSAKEIGKRAVNMAINRQKNSSMIHIDGSKLQLLSQKEQLLN